MSRVGNPIGRCLRLRISEFPKDLFPLRSQGHTVGIDLGDTAQSVSLLDVSASHLHLDEAESYVRAVGE